ncbi:MAG: sarcosine oxidase subunit gamma [Gemmobacter sp.]|nr:sarcosine oxidase subunit gamma [Gemmobacter sp.]
MPNLISKSPCAGLHLPLTSGGITLSEDGVGPITSVAPFVGQDKAVTKALKPLGLTFPEPNSVVSGKASQMVWTGRGQAFMIGAAPTDALAACAALTDQSDGWACLRLQGPQAEAALARLVPLDLRPAAFGAGAAARSLLNHMPVILIRTGDGIAVMVFRSMAATAVHEIKEAMDAVAARTFASSAQLA